MLVIRELEYLSCITLFVHITSSVIISCVYVLLSMSSAMKGKSEHVTSRPAATR